MRSGRECGKRKFEGRAGEGRSASVKDECNSLGGEGKNITFVFSLFSRKQIGMAIARLRLYHEQKELEKLSHELSWV